MVAIDDTFCTNKEKYYSVVVAYKDRCRSIQPLGFAFIQIKTEELYKWAIDAVFELAGVPISQIECVRIDGCQVLGGACKQLQMKARKN